MVLRRNPPGRRHVARLATVSLISLSLVGLSGAANADLLGGLSASSDRDLCLPKTPLVDLPASCAQRQEKEPSAAPSGHTPAPSPAHHTHHTTVVSKSKSQSASRPQAHPQAHSQATTESHPKSKPDTKSKAGPAVKPQAEDPNPPCTLPPPLGGLGEAVSNIVQALPLSDPCLPTPPPASPPPTSPPPTSPTPPPNSPPPTTTPPTSPGQPTQPGRPTQPGQPTNPGQPTTPGFNGQIPSTAGPAQPIGGNPDFTG